MGGHPLNLVFLLVCCHCTAFTIANSRVELYITPSVDSSCSQDPCLTLSQFAAGPSNYIGTETNISLVFLPGYHTLERELSPHGVKAFSMESQDNERAVIECVSQSARFVVNYETTFVSVKGLQLTSCASMTVSKVEKLVVEDTIFQGVKGEGRGTALFLNEVKFAKIIKSSFVSNLPGVNSERHRVGDFVRDQFTLNEVGLQPNDHVSVGGALAAISSNVSVTHTNFFLNTAEIGGALAAYQSNVTITQSSHWWSHINYWIFSHY